MSDSKFSKLLIRNKPGAEGELSRGANMEVLVDGVPLKGVTRVKFDVAAGTVGMVSIQMYADVEIDANVDLSKKSDKEIDMRWNDGKPVALREIGNYEPKALVTKKT